MCAYEKNNDFGNNDIENFPPDLISTPAHELYRDINLDSPHIPHVTYDHLIGYLSCFNQEIDRGTQMYKNKYLCYVKYCLEGEKGSKCF